MSNEVVPIEVVLEYIGKLCSPCQAKWRDMMANYPQSTGVLNRVPNTRVIFKEMMNEIISDVSKKTGIPVDLIHAKTNDSKIVEARRQIAIRARAIPIPYTFIASTFRKHHTTIIHLVEGKRPHAPVKNGLKKISGH